MCMNATPPTIFEGVRRVVSQPHLGLTRNGVDVRTVIPQKEVVGVSGKS